MSWNQSQAIRVTNEIEITWDDLGRLLAEQKSSDQAAFICGFYEEVTDEQLASIGGEPVYGVDRRDIAEVIDSLARFIREGS